MKKSLLLILVSIMAVGMKCLAAKDAAKAYYIEMTDGSIQTLWTDWVDSMRVSRIGLDSVPHSDFVTQEVWLTDTVLRYNLADISRISFVTPAPVLNEGVVDLRGEIYKYIIESDSLTVYLRKGTPSSLIPPRGTLICYPFVADVFPAAFAGEIAEIRQERDRIALDCHSASLLDVFDTYYSTYNDTVINTEGPEGRNFDHPLYQNDLAHTFGWHPESPIHVNLTPLLNYSDHSHSIQWYEWDAEDPEDLAFRPEEERQMLRELEGKHQLATSSGPQLSVDVRPNIDIRVVTVVTHRPLRRPALYVSAHMRSTFDQSFNIAVDGRTEARRNFSIMSVELPTGPFVRPSLEIGGFLKGSIEASMALCVKNTQRHEWLYNFAVGEEVPLRNARVEPTHTDPVALTFGSYFKGEVALGLYAELSLNLIHHDISRVSAEAEVGVRAALNVCVPMAGTSQEIDNDWVYDMMRDNYFSVEPYFGFGLDVLVGNRPLFGNLLSYENTIGQPFFKRSLVPDITSVMAARDSDHPAKVKAESQISGDCFTSWRIGFMSRGQNNTVYEPEKFGYLETPYRNNSSVANGMFSVEIDSLATSRDYKLYPVLSKGLINIPIMDPAIVNKSLSVVPRQTTVSDAGLLSMKADVSGFDEREQMEVGIRYRKADEPYSWTEAPVDRRQSNHNEIELESSIPGVTGGEYEYYAYSTVDNSMVESDTVTLNIGKQSLWEPVALTCDEAILLVYNEDVDLSGVKAFCMDGAGHTAEEILQHRYGGEDVLELESKEIELHDLFDGINGKGIILKGFIPSFYDEMGLTPLFPNEDYSVCIVYENGHVSQYGRSFNVRTKPTPEGEGYEECSGNHRLGDEMHKLYVTGNQNCTVTDYKYARNVEISDGSSLTLVNCSGYSPYTSSNSVLNPMWIHGGILNLENCYYDEISTTSCHSPINIKSSTIRKIIGCNEEVNFSDCTIKGLDIFYMKDASNPYNTRCTFNRCELLRFDSFGLDNIVIANSIIDSPSSLISQHNGYMQVEIINSIVVDAYVDINSIVGVYVEHYIGRLDNLNDYIEELKYPKEETINE